MFGMSAWFGMSATDYDGALDWSTFRTAGWFILGLPFIAGFAALYSALFCLVAIRKSQTLAWVALVVVSAVLFMLSIYCALPSTRVRYVVGEAACRVGRLEQLRVSDSFNDGITTRGVISGPDELIEIIREHRPLEREPGADRLTLFRALFEDAELPDTKCQRFRRSRGPRLRLHRTQTRVHQYQRWPAEVERRALRRPARSSGRPGLAPDPVLEWWVGASPGDPSIVHGTRPAIGDQGHDLESPCRCRRRPPGSQHEGDGRISAAHTYSESSGVNGTPGGRGSDVPAPTRKSASIPQKNFVRNREGRTAESMASRGVQP